jgi:hypothetical protein
MGVTIIGIDLAKNLFRLHGCDEPGRAVLRKQLSLSSFCAVGADEMRGSCALAKPFVSLALGFICLPAGANWIELPRPFAGA